MYDVYGRAAKSAAEAEVTNPKAANAPDASNILAADAVKGGY